MPTIREVLAGSGLAEIDAEVLLGSVLDRPRSWLLAHSDERVDQAAAKCFAALLGRRQAGEPVAYLTGSKEFYGREFTVTPDVLCPRPDTEALVERALGVIRPGDTVFDVGTGSGCVGISIALEQPDASVTLSDISASALRVAQENAARTGAKITTMHAPGLPEAARSVPSGRLVVVANLPYLDASDDALPFEPGLALDGGPDGLAVIRILVGQLRHHRLRPRHLLLEHGETQGPAVRRLVGEAAVTTADLAGRERVTGY